MPKKKHDHDHTDDHHAKANKSHVAVPSPTVGKSTHHHLDPMRESVRIVPLPHHHDHDHDHHQAHAHPHHIPAPHVGWNTVNDAEAETASEAESTILFSILHHTHSASLYGPIPEIEKKIITPHKHHTKPKVLQFDVSPSIETIVRDGVEESALNPSDDAAAADGAPPSQSKSLSVEKSKERLSFSEWMKKKCDELEDISDDDRIDALGEWDYWKAYYCAKSTTLKNMKREYFAWILLICIGQCSVMELIHFINKYGSVFILISTITLFGLGFPLYLLETGMGQYSGRKPLQMFRYLSPALTGLSGLLYLRTLVLAIRSLGIFLYSIAYAVDFFFCRINTNEVLDAFFHHNPPDYSFLHFTSILNIQNRALIILLIFLLGAIFVIVLRSNINSLGKLFRIGNHLLLILLLFYFSVILLRTINQFNTGENVEEIIKQFNASNQLANVTLWSPTYEFLTFRPIELVNGKLWIDAVLFSITSLNLGTLVHPYLGSRSFFHYRTVRDGFLLIVCIICWNYILLTTLLLWNTYITPNHVLIKISFDNLGGPYGLLLVYTLKHIQAQLTGQIESDIMFYIGIFYTVLGGGAYLSLIAYIHILTHSSYQERTTIGFKFLIYITISILFLIVFPILLFCKEGLQDLIFLDFYINRCLILPFFTIGCYLFAVMYGHTLPKFVYDFRNMMHYEIFGASRANIKPVKIARPIIIITIIGILIHAASLHQCPTAGKTSYHGTASYFAIGGSWLVCLIVLLIGIYLVFGCTGYTGRPIDTKRPFRPHRDWFKNRFHYTECFLTKKQVKDGDGDDESSGVSSNPTDGEISGSASTLATRISRGMYSTINPPPVVNPIN